MNKLAIPLSILLLIPAPTFAANSQDSVTRADDDCAKLSRACSAAAAELRAARELIKGYEAHIAAADAKIEIAAKEIEMLKEIGDAQGERAAKLEAAIAAEREAKAALVKLKQEQEQRIAKLEKRLNRSRIFALIAGVIAIVAILVGARK